MDPEVTDECEDREELDVIPPSGGKAAKVVGVGAGTGGGAGGALGGGLAASDTPAFSAGLRDSTACTETAARTTPALLECSDSAWLELSSPSSSPSSSSSSSLALSTVTAESSPALSFVSLSPPLSSPDSASPPTTAGFAA
ncbi:hypothetical protein M427DRAFT_55242 [Gonapodya prolifera JEL478]|uniref:Uncharacterized protein n=1 Tax=Gonapodya prolifera (strain JEL478) TaxID=1344416 RepID=A0A139AIP5_GONPJ|nr:hypothetical protein M427DRAFT_55242 [Gonapodya prolifera JEL478]|eukprot:KXS16579.1 hypothetical protein M427DRAFT_55242 [Gonapodya prolifera JEL478]